MDKTERITPEQYRQLQGKKPAPNPPVAPQPASTSGNLYPPIKPALWCALDPGVLTGFALWKPQAGTTPGQFLEVTALSFVATVRRLEKLRREFGPAALRVRIENPRGNLPTFDNGVAPTVENMKKREKMSQNVGSNKRDAQLLMDFLTDLGIPFDAIVPQGGGTKVGKVTDAYFAGVKGFPTRSNQHGRDAAALIVGL